MCTYAYTKLHMYMHRCMYKCIYTCALEMCGHGLRKAKANFYSGDLFSE